MEFEGKEISFKTALEEIEKIVMKLENGDETLEKNLELFKKGTLLCESCKKQLEDAKLEIQYFNDGVVKN